MPQASHRIHRAVYITLLATIALIAPTIIAGLRASASDLPGIISRWSAEGNANDSVGSNNGTLRGGVSFVSGVVGQAFNFNGSGADVEVPDSSAWSFGANPFTIALWAKFNGPNGGAFIASDDGSGTQKKWIFSSALSFHINSPQYGPIDPVYFPWSPQPGKWYHVAVTRNGSTYKLYLNGVEVASGNDSHVIADASAPLTIGQAEGGFNFNGALDEIVIYNRPLTPTEIQTLISEDLGGRALTYTSLTTSSNSVLLGQPVTFTATVSSDAGTPDGSVEFFDGAASLGVEPLSGGTATITVPSLSLGQHSIRAVYAQTTNYKESSVTLTVEALVTDQMGRVSYWAADGDAVDSISGHNGILENGATFAPGISGQAFSFDGSGSHIEVPDSSAWSFGANPFTIALWAKFNDLSGGALIASDDGPGQQRKWIFSAGGNGLSFFIDGNVTGGVGYPYSFLPGQWYHLAVTRDGSTFMLYISGIPVTITTDQIVIPDASAPLTIGQAEGQFFFNGLLDEIGIYNRALSPDEIQSIFNPNAPPNPAIFGIATNVTGQPLGGVTMTLSGSQAATTTTTLNGFYYFDGVAANGAYTVTPSKTNYMFTPASQTFSNLTESKIANFTGTPIIDLSVSVTASSPSPAVVGFNLIYDIKVKNNGPEAVTTNLTSTLPASVVFVGGISLESGYECNPDGDHITCVLDNIDAGATETFELTVVPTAAGTISNMVNVSSSFFFDPNLGNNTVTATTTVVPPPVPTGTACVASPSGLVAWWPGDGNASDIIAGQNGTLQNGATFAPGVVGQAFNFDGSGAHVEIPDSSAWLFGANPFTIALWAKFNNTGGNQAFIASDDGGGSQNKWIFWHTGGGLTFHINSPEYGAIDPVVYPWVPEQGQWYHLAVTRNGSTYTLYVDGVQVRSTNDNHVIADASIPLTIGEAERQFFLNGLLDEIGVYNRELSTTEIQSIFNAGSYGQCKTASFTGTGSNVTVQTDAANFTFDNVSTTGTTSVSAIDPATVGQVPGGFAVSNSVAYEISTTATITGSVTLAFKVPGPISQTDFNSLAILHNVNGVLVDVTATTPARDYSTLTIYATTSSFSPFYLARRGPHINPLFDQTKAYKSGSTIPVKLQLLSASNSNLSSSGTALVARDLKLMSGNTTAPVVDSGNSNPDSTFRYDPTLGGTGGGYIFNLSTRGLVPGQYVLSFYVGSDRSFFYTVKFEVK